MSEPIDDRRATEVMRDTLAANPGDCITLDALLLPLKTRAFGAVLLLLAVPTFLPIPVGGLAGTLVICLGVEMLCDLEHPLIPQWLRRRTVRHATFERFMLRATRVLGWLERLCKPRMERLTQRPWSMLSGLALVLLGILMALPIPFTNYIFGVVLLAFAFALLERDGALVLLLWIGAVLAMATTVFFSSSLVDLIRHLF
ncbi:MAG TPA: exopolysaccharide biosynthesis protein [Rhodanobacteraceae bacterium]|nr:exopolysaccharide biosynthesis protein [Rhodanobacteraceae bacterium]